MALPLHPSPSPDMDEMEIAREHLQNGRLVKGTTILREIVSREPGQVEAHVLLGQACLGLGKLDEAAQAFQNAISADRESAEAHLGLGIVLGSSGKKTEAVASIREAARLAPYNALPHLILGGLLRELGLFEEALASCDEAIRLNPDDPEPHHRRGNILDDLCRFPEAVASYQATLERNDRHFDAINNLGASLGKLGMIEQALACFDHLLKQAPEHYSPHMNRALLWLAQGDYLRGFEEFEWRWKIPGNVPRKRPGVPWQGEPLEGRAILVHGEQGFGDAIQFIRFVPLLKEAGARVIVECPKPLHTLFQSCAAIDDFSIRGEPSGACEVHAPILSLPRLLKTTIETIPAPSGYLAAKPESVARWQERLSKIPGFRIGIAWQGDRTHPRDRVRSIPLSQYEPLADIDGVRLIRLQKGFGSEQLVAWHGKSPIVDPDSIAPDDWVDFQDTAAIMANLDLVITPDTSPAHLAGALGVPVWVVLPYSAEWRWLVGREDSPWYRSARLFRQKTPGDWNEVFGRIVEELSTLLRRV